MNFLKVCSMFCQFFDHHKTFLSCYACWHYVTVQEAIIINRGLNKSIFINKFHLPNSRSTFGFFVSFVDSTRDDSRKIILLYKNALTEQESTALCSGDGRNESVVFRRV